MSKERDWGVANQTRITRIKSGGNLGDGDLPSYRYYGKRRRAHPLLDKISFYALLSCWFFLCALYVFAFVAVGYGFFFGMPEMWIKVLVLLVVGVVATLRLTKTLRCRRKFYRQLKKVCQRSKARLTVRPRFVFSSAGQEGREDIRIESGLRVFYVQYLLLPKHRTTVYIEKSGDVRVVKQPINNKFSIIFNKKPKVRYYSTAMKTPALDGRHVIRALVFDPGNQNLRFEKHDGGFEATGNGGEHFGITVYTVSGFFDAIQGDKKR